MKLAIFLVTLIAAFGCQPQVAHVGPRPSPEWCKSHFCMTPEETVFTPAGEGMNDVVKAALARMGRATGRDIPTDAQTGIPVIWQETIIDAQGIEDCAQTVAKGFAGQRLWTQAIYLDPTPLDGCPSPETSLLHELIHALAPEAEHVDEVDSLFYKSIGWQDRKIDAAALGRLCETFDCLEFRPEI